MNKSSVESWGDSPAQGEAETHFVRLFSTALRIPSIPALVTEVQGMLDGVEVTLKRDPRWTPARVWEDLDEDFQRTARRIRHTLGVTAAHVGKAEVGCPACASELHRLRFETLVGDLFAELALAIESPSAHLSPAMQCAACLERAPLAEGHRGSYTRTRSACVQLCFQRSPAGIDARMLEWLDQLAALRDGP